MSDITKCTQTLCPNSAMCWRMIAPAKQLQSYCSFDYTVSVRGVECENYIPAYTSRATHNTNNSPASAGGGE